MHACLLTAHRVLTTDQSTVTTEVQFGESMSFTRVGYRSMGELLRRTEITKKKIVASLRHTPTWLTAPKSWKPGIHCTACRQLSNLRVAFPRVSVQLV